MPTIRSTDNAHTVQSYSQVERMGTSPLPSEGGCYPQSHVACALQLAAPHVPASTPRAVARSRCRQSRARHRTLPNIPFVRCPRVSPRLLLRAAPILRLWRLWLSGAPPGLTHESCASSRSSSSASRRSGLSARSLTTLRTASASASSISVRRRLKYSTEVLSGGGGTP